MKEPAPRSALRKVSVEMELAVDVFYPVADVLDCEREDEVFREKLATALAKAVRKAIPWPTEGKWSGAGAFCKIKAEVLRLRVGPEGSKEK